MSDEEKLVYVYGLIPAVEVKSAVGTQTEQKVQMQEFGEVVAVFDYVDPEVFSQQHIEANLNDAQWVKEKAIYHHKILTFLQQKFTVIPLKFCTIFSDRKSLEGMLMRHYEELVSLFSFLHEKEEWNLKIYCNKEKFRHFIMKNNESVKKVQEEMDGVSPGRRFFMKKKLDTVIENEIESEMKQICMDVHEEAVSISVKDSVKNVWGRNVTGRKEEMAWSSVYLMDRQKIDEFMQMVQQHEYAFNDLGFSFETSGPWPVYHFANLDTGRNM